MRDANKSYTATWPLWDFHSETVPERGGIYEFEEGETGKIFSGEFLPANTKHHGLITFLSPTYSKKSLTGGASSSVVSTLLGEFDDTTRALGGSALILVAVLIFLRSMFSV